MNVDEWIEYIIVSDKKVALPMAKFILRQLKL